ncbi:uncharacterized protein EDB91DRAFT_1175112 [Suillus paluster]|uniref:uncharacterized protein n=1 Tax=Suillus paluster TaxID=48578 RepID=UPI001B8722FB|nr:uncharacterized protein EDB91DRAFT_1175112 [Suillus paluster]KAG1722113.1 hypothetical protein EDB91DRAFT_1175112 [Suillus paluster]
MIRYGTTIHAHERYNDVVQLYDALKHSLPKHQRHFIPPSKKSPFSHDQLYSIGARGNCSIGSARSSCTLRLVHVGL